MSNAATATTAEIIRKEHDDTGDIGLGKAGNYGWDIDNSRWLKLVVNEEGELKVNLETADIQIGAVEIKNATTDDRAIVDTSGQLNVKQSGLVDTNNSTVQTLNAGIAFTGDATDITDYSIIFITVYSNKASATDGLSIQQSSDGTNWDNTDEYTVPADAGKTYSIQAGAKWFRIVYTNGAADQGVFRMQTVLKKNNALASSHRLQDNITNDDDAELVKAVISVQTNDELTYKNIDVQNPMPVDGDSVYAKDLDLVHTVTTGWTSINGGTVSDLFGEHDKGLTFTGSDNPKSLTIQFRRPVITTGGMGIVTETGSFSNVKVIAVQQDGTETVLKDFSSDNTDRTILPIQFAPTGFASLRFEFHTVDVISLTNIFIPKAVTTIARIQALKPDGTVTDIDATTGGNLKISMEEMAGTVDDNNSTSTPLGIDAVFPGASTDVLNYASISIIVFADEDSATDGLSVQWSSDNTNWDVQDDFTITASIGKTFNFQPTGRYMKVVYTNGGTEQSAFRLQTVLRPVTIKGSTHRLSDEITTQDDAELVKAILAAETSVDTFTNLRSDATTGALDIISYPHHEIHAGSSFTVDDVQNINTDTEQWMITTPDTTKNTHMLFNIEATGEMLVVITEGADRTGTNALVEINRRRVGTPNVAATTVHRAVSDGTTDGAITIFSKRSGSTNAGGQSGTPGGARGTNEFILKQNTKYIVTVTTYADIYVSTQLDWYEHADVT